MIHISKLPACRFLSFAAPQSVLDARVETRWRDFENSSDLPQNDLRTGAQTRGGVTYSYHLSPGFVITTQGYVQRENAKANFYSDWELAASGGFAWTSITRCGRRSIPRRSSEGGGGRLFRNFDDPDPTINQNAAEVDHMFWTRGALVLPVAETWAFVPQVEYRDQHSNYELYSLPI